MQFKKLSQKQLIECEKSRDEFALRLRMLTWTPSDSEQRVLDENKETNVPNSNDWFFRLNLLVQFNPNNSTRQIANRAKLTRNEVAQRRTKSNESISQN